LEESEGVSWVLFVKGEKRRMMMGVNGEKRTRCKEWLVLAGDTVLADDDGVVALVGLEGDLLAGLELVVFQLLDLTGEDGLWGSGRVDAVGLDGDHKVSTVLQKVLGVEGDDTGLVGLGDVSENGVDHTDDHSVFVGVTGVLDDGDDVCALLGEVQEIASRTVRKFNSIYKTIASNDIRDV